MTNNIQQFRFECDQMTQKKLADLIGVSRQTMNAIENGRHAPTVDVAIRIADVFREPVEGVFQYEYRGKPELTHVIITMPSLAIRDRPDCTD